MRSDSESLRDLQRHRGLLVVVNRQRALCTCTCSYKTMPTNTADSFGYDLEELRRRSLNHEIRRRRVDTPSRVTKPSIVGVDNATPDAKRRSVLLAEIRRSQKSAICSGDVNREQMTDFNESNSSLVSNSPNSRKERLGVRTLQTINVQKESIAELRPTRRKIKWNSAISDWERKSDVEKLQPKHRLSNLELKDLHIHGVWESRPGELQRAQAEANDEKAEREKVIGLTENPEHHTDQLEDCIRQRFHELRSVQRETAETRKHLYEVEKMNTFLREQVECMNAQHRRTSNQPQSHSHVKLHLDRLRAKLTKLDEDLGQLKMQKKTIDADCLILQELLDVTSVNHRDLDEPGPVSVAEESDIKSYLTGEFTSEDMGCFSFAPNPTKC
jgi:hypothetical protein